MVEVFDFDYTPYAPEEKVIDGVLCVKYSEDADFTPLSAEDLTELYLYVRENLEQLRNDSVANAKRIVACVNACKGLTNEVLDKGILEDAIALVLNAGKDIGVTWDDVTPYYEGVKVWEEK